MKRDYPRLGIVKFGKRLLETEDLDPVYVMLWKSKLHPKRLKRWLMAYSMFYHVGVATKLSDFKGQQFWLAAATMARPESKTPRGTERRHFRGVAAAKSITYFAKHYPKGPEQAIGHLIRGCRGTFDGLSSLLHGRWPLYGPWVAFKLADLLERLQIAPIRFPIKTLKMYAEPTKAAHVVAKVKGWPDDVFEVTSRLIAIFYEAGFKAPPRYERPVNAQEVETILCKWKSHMNGHYPVGKDSIEYREAMKGWGLLAKRMKKNLPKP